MDVKTAKRDRFDWRLPLSAAIGALILFAPIMLYGGDAVAGEILYMFVAFPSVSLILLIVAIRKKGLRRLSGLVDVGRLFGRLRGLVHEL
jgi:hypothetical protein